MAKNAAISSLGPDIIEGNVRIRLRGINLFKSVYSLSENKKNSALLLDSQLEKNKGL